MEAKDPRYGGNPNVVIATPDIKAFKILDSYDYIIKGCDGIFEKLNNQNIFKVSNQVVSKNNNQTMHEKSGLVIDQILNHCVEQKTLDNITAVMIGFKGFERISE